MQRILFPDLFYLLETDNFYQLFSGTCGRFSHELDLGRVKQLQPSFPLPTLNKSTVQKRHCHPDRPLNFPESSTNKQKKADHVNRSGYSRCRKPKNRKPFATTLDPEETRFPEAVSARKFPVACGK